METHPLPEPSSPNTAPPADPSAAVLTTWEAKERAGLLAMETEEWREKRLIAEDPNTTADVLERLTRDIEAAWAVGQNGSRIARDKCYLLEEAVVAHPNTPLLCLSELIWRSHLAARAFCRNPIVPFLLLEQPGFVADLHIHSQYILLGHAATPAFLVQMLATGAAKNDIIREAARTHIRFAGEATIGKRGQQELRDYWRGFRAQEMVGDKEEKQQWHVDQVEIGHAPAWAADPALLTELDPLPTVPVLDEWFRFAHKPYSPEENALLAQIGGRTVRHRGVVRRGLSASAKSADLLTLFRSDTKPQYHRGLSFEYGRRLGVGDWGARDDLVGLAILRHPSVDVGIIREMALYEDTLRYEEMLARHPLTPPDIVARLLQSKLPDVRRLARRHPNAPANATQISQQAPVGTLMRHETMDGYPSSFMSLVMSLTVPGFLEPKYISEDTETWRWPKRLEVALSIKANATPLMNDQYERTELDALHHLAHDGNRFVRWAAQTRLADPDFVFTWHDESGD